MDRVGALEHDLWHLEELATASSHTRLADDENNEVRDVSNVLDSVVEGSSEVVRGPNGTHTHRFAPSLTHSNPELVLEPPHPEHHVNTHAPPLTDEIMLEQVVFDLGADIAMQTRVAAAAEELVVEARNATRRDTVESLIIAAEETKAVVETLQTVRGKRVVKRSAVGNGLRQTRHVKPPEYLDLDEDTDVDHIDWFTQVDRS